MKWFVAILVLLGMLIIFLSAEACTPTPEPRARNMRNPIRQYHPPYNPPEPRVPPDCDKVDCE